MSKADDLARRYEGAPILKALAELVPAGVGGALNAMIADRVEEIDRDRLSTLLNEVATGARPLTQEIIASEDFLHCFFATIRAARRTRQRQKIRFFGRLLSTAFEPDNPACVDRFERYLGILEELTYEELHVLATIARHERAAPADGNPVQRTSAYWPALRSELATGLQVPKDAVEAVLTRLSRTGLYQPIMGTFWDYDGGCGMLTPLYRDLEALVRAHEL